MNDMKLSYFTNDESFPLFVQFGGHDVPLLYTDTRISTSL